MERGIVFNLYENEKMVSVIRRHWLAFVPNILISLFLIIIFFVGVFSINSFLIQPNPLVDSDGINTISKNIGEGALIIFASMYLLSALGYFYVSWLDYYMDIFIITNKRIIRFEQLVLFGQRVSETSFQHVQDVSSQVKGFINTLLNVGTVFIETAGERENFSFTYFLNPGEIATEILELQKHMWDEEGIKDDMMNDRKNEKIDSMNADKELKKMVGNDNESFSFSNPNISEKKPESKVQSISEEDKPAEKSDLIEKDIIAIPENNQVINTSKQYKDGSVITEHGVVWQSEINATPDVLDTLNKMEE